jgi:hypothetical protein
MSLNWFIRHRGGVPSEPASLSAVDLFFAAPSTPTLPWIRHAITVSDRSTSRDKQAAERNQRFDLREMETETNSMGKKKKRILWTQIKSDIGEIDLSNGGETKRNQWRLKYIDQNLLRPDENSEKPAHLEGAR